MKKIPDFILEQIPDGIKSKTAMVDGYEIHYLEKGSGIPVFLLHGNPTWSFIYRNIIDKLDPEKYRCIAPDLLGLGFSDKPKDPNFHTLANHKNVMINFLKKVIDDDFIFVGQDWGGPIGLLASMNQSYNLKGMVLLNTSILPPKKDFKSTLFHKFSHLPFVSDLAFRIFGFPQNYLSIAQGHKDSIRGKVSKAYSYPLKKAKENIAPLMMARMVPDSHEHPSVKYLEKTKAYAENFKGPVSIIWGKNDPVLGRLSSAHTRLLPHANFTETDGGHFIQEEYPGLISNAISDL
ncbi:alpha/beta fold hydrolase [Mangrovivirga sp. M17]|uniref:Alpha/beta fold hydrolase n=1 Tax=Mangrovivirga halotolerans TaxID=2993936 RepID=A0ABT3RR46_9BACT|nr:alpha/beta fold hydrolase [Mangrovivirga halotolerans]MCX2744033.1 alpha/beta fold hydrolase [Mangrovivirga halotolerans]